MAKFDKNNKKVLFGALSALAASVAAGVIVKKTMDNKAKAKEDKGINVELEKAPEKKLKKEKVKREKVKKEKRNKKVYYTVSLNDLYNPYDDKTLTEEDMINEIRKETSL